MLRDSLNLKLKNFLCLACVYRVMDARAKFGEHERSVRVARGDSTAKSMNEFFYNMAKTYWALKHVYLRSSHNSPLSHGGHIGYDVCTLGMKSRRCVSNLWVCSQSCQTTIIVACPCAQISICVTLHKMEDERHDERSKKFTIFLVSGAFHLQPTKILKTNKENGSISCAMFLDQRVTRAKGGISADTRFRPNFFISPLLSVSSPPINIK